MSVPKTDESVTGQNTAWRFPEKMETLRHIRRWQRWLPKRKASTNLDSPLLLGTTPMSHGFDGNSHGKPASNDETGFPFELDAPLKAETFTYALTSSSAGIDE
jgi:hypothetical protein